MKKLPNNQRFQTVLPPSLIVAGMILALMGTSSALHLLFPLGFVAGGIGVVLQIRRYNRSLLLTAAIIIALLIAYSFVSIEIFKATFSGQGISY